MWEGAVAPIPAEALRGTDGDSGPEDLVYTIEQPSNGRVVLWVAPGTKVRSFTQAVLTQRWVLRAWPQVPAAHGGALRCGASSGQRTQCPRPQEPWTEASPSASLTASTLPPDTSSE
ncbi:hypothetical protein P7K49_017340 [Saguinus oedipus]|uniref:Uncharacterized protein n=1 Tax=Saguinus oedipus TaxID=9490 RepID=A0ABQ9V285_SAGOE|nr:hypothetical protein P7K49_017340 [Saguinus oedipus]